MKIRPIYITVFIVIIFITIGTIFYFKISKNGVTTTPQNYGAQINSIEKFESSQPVKFLKIYGGYEKNFFGTKFKLSCSINNKAKVARFKDVIIKITSHKNEYRNRKSKNYCLRIISSSIRKGN